MAAYRKPLFIFEMANNHQGSVEHGIKIVEELKKVSEPYEPYFDFAVKFQYRDLDTFIREDYKNRNDIKNVKRFKETRLNKEQFAILREEVKKNGFLAVCTPFDEKSVDLIMEQGYDAIKIASCSFGDWPLLEKIGKQGKRVIASCAAAELEQIEKVVHFFQHRNIELSLMHCVAEYPTDLNHLQMNQIDFLRNKFPNIPIGFSTHEDPNNNLPVRIAVAKSAQIFEKHVGVETDTIKLNGYSATPKQVEGWLAAAYEAYQMCGGCKEERCQPTAKEREDLKALQRGAFAKKDLERGDSLNQTNVSFAFPCEEGQLLATHFSKYNGMELQKAVLHNNKIEINDVKMKDNTQTIQNLVEKVMELLKESKIVLPVNTEFHLSHHYGIDKFDQMGCAIIDCINREYCKKILVMLAGQDHPSHVHYKKEETFSVVYGELIIKVGNEVKCAKPGECIVIERGMEHSFSSVTGCVFEEISTTHYVDDSNYKDKEQFVNPRKTAVYVTKEMLDNMQLKYTPQA
ncbi:MAG: N-acetylneuraminate synthase family protein [Lachnospiraceae bacterium]